MATPFQMPKTLKNWRIEEITGYKPQTTFYTDFSLAELFGTKGIRETFDLAFKEWKNNTVYITEFTMALNWKCWEHEHHADFGPLYLELFEKMDDWCRENLTGEDLTYYYQTTD